MGSILFMFYVSSSKGFNKVPFGLNQELLDRALLVYLLASHRQIQITVMFDWVTAGIELRGAPVAQLPSVSWPSVA